MSSSHQDKIEIVELKAETYRLVSLKGRSLTDSYYEVFVKHGPKEWVIKLLLKPFGKPREKVYTGRLFEEHLEEPRALAAKISDIQVGWIELGYEKWNNRMRVWEFLVKEEFRRKGIGSALMKQAMKIAKRRGARMLVLETQSCDVPAIQFYLKQGFDLIGFDLTAYSNDDIERKEVRLEFGLSL